MSLVFFFFERHVYFLLGFSVCDTNTDPSCQGREYSSCISSLQEKAQPRGDQTCELFLFFDGFSLGYCVYPTLKRGGNSSNYWMNLLHLSVSVYCAHLCHLAYGVMLNSFAPMVVLCLPLHSSPFCSSPLLLLPLHSSSIPLPPPCPCPVYLSQSRIPGTIIPLCSAQCERMFNTTRIPRKEAGNISKHISSTHTVLLKYTHLSLDSCGEHLIFTALCVATGSNLRLWTQIMIKKKKKSLCTQACIRNFVY